MRTYRFDFLALAAGMAAALSCPSRLAAAEKAGAAPPAPPLPAIQSLKLDPASLTLHDARDERRVLVLGVAEGGQIVDLTEQANFKVEGASIELGEKGYLRPKSKGQAAVLVSAAGKEAKLEVNVEGADATPVRFVRDIEPLLGKAGCNAGTCHGSAKGKNGFKLSLRGYDPEFDYQALINDLSGRRFNRVKVEESLMLLKPTAEVPHEGRQPLKPGSREYHILRQWIAEGTKFEEPAKNRVQSIEVLPSEVELDLPGR